MRSLNTLLLIPAFLVFLSTSFGQISATDSLLLERMDEVVISATRTEKKAEEIALPSILLYGKEIQLSGYTDLNELLAEQTGMVISQDHGSGIQIQGFDPEYTMLLIDGDPMIGRAAGVIDLRRINLRNVARIEIIKGSGSCLYGSEAMAGVINIITKSPKEELDARVFGAIGNPTETEIGTTVSGKNGGVGWSAFATYQNMRGFDLNPDLVGVNLGRSEKINLQGKTYMVFGDYDVKTSVRYYRDFLPGDLYEAIGDDPFFSRGVTEDISATVTTTRTWNKGVKTEFKVYGSSHQSEGAAAANQGELELGFTNFNQRLLNPEFVVNYPKSASSSFLFGVGARFEDVSSSRYQQLRPMYTQYAFTQWQYRPVDDLEIITGVRADNGNWFGSQISPKASVNYKRNNIRYKASVGYGFKTPDFRQLYLNFTNIARGYTVLGTEAVNAELQQLEQNGVVTRRLPAANQIAELNPERSRSVNVGMTYAPNRSHSVDVNVFYNNIQNLINDIPVAVKSNGRFVFSYINQENVVTRGLEAKYNYRPRGPWEFMVGGQYLEAIDTEAKKGVRNGEFFYRDENLNTRVLQVEDYVGLFGRSRFAFNAKVTRNFPELNGAVFIRWNWRSSYPFADVNGNGVADAYDTHFPDFHFINASMQWGKDRFQAVLSVQNILNNQSVEFLPNNPGTSFLLTLNYTLTSND